MKKLFIVMLAVSFIGMIELVQVTSAKKNKKFNGIQKVKNLYEMISAGDIPAVLETLSPDIHWQVECSSEREKMFYPYDGVEEVSQFFGNLAKSIDVLEFNPETFMTADNGYTVSVRAKTTTQSLLTKKVVSSHVIHYFWFDKAGKLMKVSEILDTYAYMDMLAQGQTKASLEILATKFSNYLEANMPDEAMNFFWPDAQVFGLMEDAHLPVTVEEAKEAMMEYFAAFPDAKLLVRSIVANSNEVAVRAWFVGTQMGPLFGIPATMKHVDFSLAFKFNVIDGKVGAAWFAVDKYSLLMQLGFKIGM